MGSVKCPCLLTSPNLVCFLVKCWVLFVVLFKQVSKSSSPDVQKQQGSSSHITATG